MATSTTKEIQKVSAKGLEFIAKQEGGFYLKPYLDPIKIPTISAGVTWYEDGRKVKITDPAITMERAHTLFSNVLHVFEMGVYSRTRDDINQQQFDSLVDFAYNVGLGNFASSTLLKKVNANPKDPSIRNEFVKWVYAKGKKLKGLELRRGKEADMYFS